jgi:endonuclease/exonuclease/phosphatase family metal-dependent hydrolase
MIAARVRPQTDSGASSAPFMIFRVATYNIRKSVGLDRRRRPDRILAVLDEIGADIVALQEADRRFGARAATLPAAALAEAGWRPAPLRRKPSSLGWHGNAVLLGPAARLERARGLDLPGLEPRGAALADLSIHGRRLRVLGMHLGLTGGPRRRQAARILAEAESHPRRPSVLMGDTNEWRDLAGCLALFGRRHALSPPAPTFHTSAPVAALDRIAISAGLVFDRCAAHDSTAAKRASDHLPLWADLRFEAEAAEGGAPGEGGA